LEDEILDKEESINIDDINILRWKKWKKHNNNNNKKKKKKEKNIWRFFSKGKLKKR
jgi:hypothetical protein